MERIITSAALYFRPTADTGVSLRVAAEACAFLAQCDLPVQEFAIETCTRDVSGLFEYKQHEKLLEGELARGNVSILGLYSNPNRESDLVMDWHALAYIDMARGNCFLGAPLSVHPQPGRLLKVAYGVFRALAPMQYGIGYFRSASQGPDFYAVGIIANSFDFSMEGVAENDRITKWLDEMAGRRRYLDGMYRDAYPATLLSAAHLVQPFSTGKDLFALGIGQVERVDETHWLWELTGDSIAAARRELECAGLSICI
jgi:hypothetical protein